METKYCNRCHIDKPIEEFYKNKRKKDGLDTRCILCHKNDRERYGNYQEVKDAEMIEAKWKNDLLKAWRKVDDNS